MANGYDYRKFGVLYVDDEEQSLKYFPKAFGKDFKVLTANSVEQALKILETEGDGIGIVITDQRMPGKSGVDLLGHLRQARPNIIRILTTAYADIDSAIDAVNSGAIYKYVVKPWNLKDLRGVLLRGMEFFLVQRERDMLFREKLSVLQKLIIADRVRSLAALAAGLSHHIRHSMLALIAFFDLELPNLLEAPATLPTAGNWQDMWGLAQAQSQHVLQVVQKVADTVAEPNYTFADEADLKSLVRSGINQVLAKSPPGSEGKFLLEMSPGLPRLKVDKVLVERLFRILIEQTARLNRPDGTVLVVAKSVVPVWGTTGIQIVITGEGTTWTDQDVASIFTPFTAPKSDPNDLGLDLLSAFFIAYHHGGDLTVHRRPPGGPGFELVLPFSPDVSHRPDLQEDLLEKLFLRYEMMDSAQQSQDVAADASGPQGSLRSQLRGLQDKSP